MSGLFKELMRRNVFRVGVAYAVLSWLLMQVADMLAPLLSLPESFSRILLAILVIGFPLALFFAWAFELTPEGLKTTAEVDADASITHNTGQKLNYVIAAALVTALGFIGWQNMGSYPASDGSAVDVSAPKASIAVLPFADLSQAGDQEYFAHGLSEEILNVLVGVDALKVASRTSSFQFKGQDIGIPEIARQLKVTYVLEGSVRKAGNTVRITGQLIEAATDRHIWSDTYDRELTTANLFAIQDELSSAIVAALSKELGLTEQIEIAVVTADTQNLSAYENFLRGRDMVHGRNSLDDVGEAIRILENVVADDPDFARGWMWLAWARAIAPSWRTPEEDGISHTDRAREAAEQALAMDASLGLAYGAMGAVISQTEPGNHIAIIDWMRRGLEQSPRDPNLHLNMAISLQTLGYLDDAKIYFSECARLDTAFANCNRHKSFNHYLLGEYKQALAGFNEISLESTFELGWVIARMLVTEGQPLAAHYVVKLATDGLEGFPADALVEVFQEDSPRKATAARKVLDWIAQQPEVSPIFLGAYSLALGAYDQFPDDLIIRFFPTTWARANSGFWKTERFRDYVRFNNFLPYWQTNGFPPQCRPITGAGGDDGFECSVAFIQ